MNISIGMTTGPNGPQIGPVLVLGGGSSSSSPPSDFTAHYTTPKGAQVTVSISQSNQADADELSKEIQDKLGLLPAESPDDMSDMPYIAAPLVGGVAMLIIGIAVMFIAVIANMGGLIDFDDVSTVGMFTARWGLLVGWPVITLLVILAKLADSNKKTA